jgi:hypothetical protein
VLAARERRIKLAVDLGVAFQVQHLAAASSAIIIGNAALRFPARRADLLRAVATPWTRLPAAYAPESHSRIVSGIGASLVSFGVNVDELFNGAPQRS